MREQAPFFNFRFIIGVLLVAVLTLSSFSFPEGVSAQVISFPAEINKEFSPISIPSGGISRLSITIFNPNLFQMTNAAWSDNLSGVQTGIIIASPSNLTNTCGGTVTISANGTALSLLNGTVPPQVGITPGSCTVSIDVTSTTPGNLINTIPAGGLTGNGGGGTITNTTPASATLRVGTVLPPTINKSFNPNTILVGQISQLTITVRNTDSNVALTQTTFTDALPQNVFLANPVGATLTNCGTTASVSGSTGDGSFTLNNGTIPAGGTCTIRVNVTSPFEGSYTNTIPVGAIKTTQGVTNGSPATATLNVQGVRVLKAFNPANVATGGTTTLTITIQNPLNIPLTNTSLNPTITDTLPAPLTVVNGTAATTCVGGNAVTVPPATVQLMGGSVPVANGTTPGTCTITVQVTVPAGTNPATFTNTIPARTLITDQNVTNTNPATAQVRVYTPGQGVGLTKTFSPATINPGVNSRLRIVVTAPADKALTNFSLVDPIPAGLVIGTPAPSKSAGCGAASVLQILTDPVTGALRISLTNGNIAAGATCRIDVYVTATVAGVYTNTINPANITNTQGETIPAPVSANLTVNSTSDLSQSKIFTPATIAPNGISLLTISLTNTNASPLVNVSLLDNLPGTTTNGIVVAPVPNAATTCGSGVVTAVPGTQVISLSGGTIPAQVAGVPGLCTITVNVQGRGVVRNYRNNIPAANVSGTIQGTTTVINPVAAASAPINITGLTIGVVKEFIPLTVFGGSASKMNVQLINPNNADLVGIAFTDNMPTGMIVANPANPSVGTCGGTITATPGDNFFSFSGGSLPPFGTCTLSLSITMTVNGNLTNTIDAGAVTTTNGASNPQPAKASLTNLPGASVSKAFSPNPINAGDYSLLTITIQNTGNIPLTGMGLIDNLPGTLPAGVAIANTPASVNNCGGTLTAVSGTQMIQLVGGTLGASSLCTIVIPVTGVTPGSYDNIIDAGSLITNEGATNNLPARDTLTILTNSALASLGDYVWLDTNADGIQDATEVGIGGVTVQLYASDGTLVGTTTTATDGSYHFTGLTPGDYYVKFVPPSGYAVSPRDQGGNDAADSDANPSNGETIITNLSAGENDLTWDAGLYQPASIGDRVWLDTNMNGIQDAGEAGIDGVTVNLYRPGYGPDGIPGNADDADIVATTTTAGGGSYLFDNLTPGNYSLDFIPPAGYVLSPQDQGGNDAVDSDASPLTGQTVVTTLTSGENDLTWAAGLYPSASLGDFVWNDTNANGIQDAGEAGIANVTVELYNSQGVLQATTTTNASGAYLFSGLVPGDYYVKFIAPNGYTLSPQDQGGNDSADSDANPSTGQTIVTTLTPGENDITWDAGLFPTRVSGLTKSITATNLPATTGTNTAIGEVVTYQVVVTVPPGSYPNATVVDTMNRGLAFVACDSIDAPGLATSVAGSFTSVCSSATTSDAGGGTPMDVDRRVTYDFGTLTNSAATDATITVTYRAIVIDIATNVNGASLTNNVTWNWTGGTIGPAQTTVTIAEPELTIAKTADVNFVSNGTDVTFTLTVSHTQASNSDAYDVILTDVLPTGLTFVAGSLDCTIGVQDPDLGCTFDNSNPAQPTIRAQWTAFTRNGGTAQIRFRVTGNASLPQNASVTNTANVEWSSMPGNQNTPSSKTPNIYSFERHYDPNDAVDVYNASATFTLNPVGGVVVPGGGTGGTGRGGSTRKTSQASGFLIPVTGFAPNVTTELNAAARPNYGSTSVTLEIPSIKVNAPIVGVELKAGNWDVSWLVDQIGWLEGTAYPTWDGNSVLTAHVVNADGKPGLFSRLNKVRVGDYIFLYQSGYRYTYQIVSNKFVQANDIKVLKHEDKATITLITCDTYDIKSATYLRRTVVRAVLIDVAKEK